MKFEMKFEEEGEIGEAHMSSSLAKQPSPAHSAGSEPESWLDSSCLQAAACWRLALIGRACAATHTP